jgi:nicotinamide mononucleotide transporter
MTDKQFNKWFSAILMGLMVVVIVITTVFKLNQPDARALMLIIAALGSVMGVASTVLSANGIIWTFIFGILDVTFCCIVAADNQIWGNFALHLFYFLPMQFVGIWQWKKRGAQGSKSEVKARRFTGKQWLIMVASVLAGLAAVYFILVQIKLRTVGADFDRAQVFFDAAVTTFNIAGQILMSLAFYEQWYLWILVNISSIFLWGGTMLSSAASSYTVVMFIKYCFYLVNSINGLRIWYKLSKQ